MDDGTIYQFTADKTSYTVIEVGNSYWKANEPREIGFTGVPIKIIDGRMIIDSDILKSALGIDFDEKQYEYICPNKTAEEYTTLNNPRNTADIDEECNVKIIAFYIPKQTAQQVKDEFEAEYAKLTPEQKSLIKNYNDDEKVARQLYLNRWESDTRLDRSEVRGSKHMPGLYERSKKRLEEKLEEKREMIKQFNQAKIEAFSKVGLGVYAQKYIAYKKKCILMAAYYDTQKEDIQSKEGVILRNVEDFYAMNPLKYDQDIIDDYCMFFDEVFANEKQLFNRFLYPKIHDKYKNIEDYNPDILIEVNPIKKFFSIADGVFFLAGLAAGVLALVGGPISAATAVTLKSIGTVWGTSYVFSKITIQLATDDTGSPFLSLIDYAVTGPFTGIELPSGVFAYDPVTITLAEAAINKAFSSSLDSTSDLLNRLADNLSLERDMPEVIVEYEDYLKFFELEYFRWVYPQ